MSSVVPSKSLGNGSLNGFNGTSSTSKLVHRTPNGRTTSSSANGSMASISESTLLERDEVQEAGASNRQYDYGVGVHKFSDRKTKPIIKLIFCKLCPACSKDLSKVEREIAKMDERT